MNQKPRIRTLTNFEYQQRHRPAETAQGREVQRPDHTRLPPYGRQQNVRRRLRRHLR